MTVLWIYVQAPFAAFRTFTAGWYRPTAAFLTPSAAYGLLLNVAGIDSRRDDGLSAMTVTRFGLPPARIALGAVPENAASRRRRGLPPDEQPSPDLGVFPAIQTLYQQLHTYPVGASGRERKEGAKGNKYNITPVRREFLTNLRACIGLDAGEDLERSVREGIAGSHSRYGLPFLGDNAFLIDRLEVLEHGPLPAHWYRRLGPEDDGAIAPHTTRLTIWIDRQEMSRTLSALFAPDPEITEEVPGEGYWTSIMPPPEPAPPAKKPRKK